MANNCIPSMLNILSWRWLFKNSQKTFSKENSRKESFLKIAWVQFIYSYKDTR